MQPNLWHQPDFAKPSKKTDPRWINQLFGPQDSTSSPLAILQGYPDDEGVILNSGRAGARFAPKSCLDVLMNRTPFSKDIKIKLNGLLKVDSLDLANRHEAAIESIVDSKKLHASSLMIGIGGGHDYGYADGMGFLKALDKSNSLKPLIINFDAHLDVRSLDKGLSSGTPFYRLIESKYDFDLVQIGIQRCCTNPEHLKWAEQKNVKVLFLEDLLQNNSHDDWSTLFPIDSIKDRPLFISLDMDVFSSSIAPGCSQSWPIGLSADSFISLTSHMMKHCQLESVGVYELSPPWDIANKTSHLAAQMIHYILYKQLQKA